MILLQDIILSIEGIIPNPGALSGNLFGCAKLFPGGHPNSDKFPDNPGARY